MLEPFCVLIQVCVANSPIQSPSPYFSFDFVQELMDSPLEIDWKDTKSDFWIVCPVSLQMQSMTDSNILQTSMRVQCV
jgi:hypothetical protein